MMYQKATTFNDINSANLIMKSNNPKQQKAFGRKVNGYNDDVWSNVARNLTYIGLIEKFRQNTEILDTLLNETDERGIVEASPFDRPATSCEQKTFCRGNITKTGNTN